MTNALFQIAGSAPLIDVNGIAYKAGLSAEAARAAGEIVFARLSGEDIDLTKALVHASSNSGADPKQILDMLKVIGDEFAKPLPEASPGFTEQLSNIGSAASEQVSHIAGSVKEKISDIDLSSVKEKISDIDLSTAKENLNAAKEKSAEIGQQVADKANQVIERVKLKFKKEE
ncbi:hypothetical protein LPB140_03460 [Sphingorhabdus lutea]|uniref:Uncharacterized protein n=1 Tax=Sphingorhabdus lutea TaxID=1913578 RepID=A0A1L3JA76_9SPHN|nr:hypothetical protein [Sphingorhabdus lutea]APG62027.1 hypothetical protein LPB140_03460 [Sphingorhabdus lutea]